jgi:peptide/nickel transport system substrate-binding protein
VWSRRAFLRRAGFGGLAAVSVTALQAISQGETAEKGAKFVVTWNAFDTIDPHVKQDVSAAAFNLNIYDNLMRYQGNPPHIVPWLAESHTVSDDGKTWTFHLRRGLQFHDGSELTAEAVRFSFERLLSMGKAPSAIFKRMGLTPAKVMPSDCRFRLRCPYAQDDPCAQHEPALADLMPGQHVACHRVSRTAGAAPGHAEQHGVRARSTEI